MSQENHGLTKKILLAMGLGLLVGLGFHALGHSPQLPFAESLRHSEAYQFIGSFFFAGLADTVGAIFVKSLQVLVVPLVFVSLVCGVSSIKDASTIGVISLKTLSLYLLTTAIAISLAITMAVLIQPGAGFETGRSMVFEAKEAPSFWQVLADIFPKNIFAAMTEANMLQIIVFAILLGIAIGQAKEDGELVMRFFKALDAVIMRLVLIIMKLAPYGVFCLMAMLFAETGTEAIGALIWYFLTVLLVLLLHGLGVMSVLLTVLARLNPLPFFAKVKNIWLFAFSTASSNATIPVTLEVVEKKLGVNNRVAAFTVPLGATINMDGTAIMQGVATVFIAQVYGIEVGIVGYLTVIATATLASIGTAGVPGVGLITLSMVLTQAGLPVEGVALIIGVDRLLDMVRTAVNVTGDAAVSSIVAKSCNELDEQTFQAREITVKT